MLIYTLSARGFATGNYSMLKMAQQILCVAKTADVNIYGALPVDKGNAKILCRN